MARPKDTGKEVEYRKKQKKALDMKVAGFTYEQIEEELGYSVGSGAAWKIVDKALKEIPRQSAEELLQLEFLRLEKVILGLARKGFKGDVPSAEAIRKTVMDQAKLMGLENITDDGGMELAMQQYERLVQAIMGTADEGDQPGDH